MGELIRMSSESDIPRTQSFIEDETTIYEYDMECLKKCKQAEELSEQTRTE